MKLNLIALTTDFSPCSRQAYAVAVTLARLQRASLILTHVDERKSGTTSEAKGARAAEEDLREELLLPVFAGVDVERTILDGVGAREVARWASDAGVDLIVSASHGHSGFRQLLVGSFVESLLGAAAVPVLTVKGKTADFKPKRILVPIDFSECCVDALEPAQEFAELFDADLYVVHVLDDPSGSGAASEKRIREEREEKLGAIVKRYLSGREAKHYVLRGPPTEKLLSWIDAADVDLVCMMARGVSNPRSRFLGSVSERVLRGASCSVLIVPSEVTGS